MTYPPRQHGFSVDKEAVKRCHYHFRYLHKAVFDFTASKFTHYASKYVVYTVNYIIVN